MLLLIQKSKSPRDFIIQDAIGWQYHFQLQDAELIALTAIARTTIWLIKLNRNDRIQERRLWLALGLVRLSE
ncbi:MAG: hypothetical protein NT070_14445 [Cyanobacteria bacterium]|nr:hypothetical protein [Cyanobacteriota bacterium]